VSVDWETGYGWTTMAHDAAPVPDDQVPISATRKSKTVTKIPGLPRFAGELSSLLFFFDYVAASFLLGRDVSEANSLPKDSLGIKHDWHIEQISARFPMRGPL